MKINSLVKPFIISVIVIFGFITLLGLSLSISGSFHIDGIKCFASEQATGCQNIGEHIANWQSSFLGIISIFHLTLLFFATSIALYFAHKLVRLVLSRQLSTRANHWHHPLQYALAQGILQPTL